MDNIFTVDVEEYYNAENVKSSLLREQIKLLPDRLSVGLRKIIDMLEDTGNKATFFVLGCIAEKNKSLIREITGLGHEIASHGYEHMSLYEHTPASFEEDLSRSLSALSDITGQRIIGFRAANFSLSYEKEWFFDILKKRGVVYDSSVSYSLFRRCYSKSIDNLSRCRQDWGVREFPVSSLRAGPINIPFGGGYFRAYPYWLTKFGTNLTAHKNINPFVFYIHPWELDPEQPHVRMPPLNSFRHYFNLKTTEPKLKRFLAEMRFASIKDFLDNEQPK
ncbi:MAG: polysaccharide deacetylase family protein [Candidatus Omnitrophica bacterium]|nr:polysaccharide deacetylase family protein [Candidatus Omnitrophota bacterium]